MSFQILAGCIEFLKLLDWFTELFKIVFNEPAGKPYWGWVILTMITSSFVLLQKLFNQVSLLMIAQKWSGSTKFFFGCITFPLTLLLLPFAYLSFALYSVKGVESDDKKVFAGRPMSTILMGLPIYSVLSTFMTKPDNALHPLQSHLRVMGGMLQTFIEDIPCLFIDMTVLINNSDKRPDLFFRISAGYSLFLIIITAIWNIVETNRFEGAAEQQTTLPPSDLKAITDKA